MLGEQPVSAEAFGSLERVPLRVGWLSESQQFTPWLAENLELLGKQLGLALEFKEREHRVGRFQVDLLLTDAQERVVVVENQLEQSDHDHLGKLLTYCAGTGARVVIWVAPSFNEEHLAALEWLNDNTVADVAFFAVELELLRIGSSPLAPNFKTLVKPNQWVKTAHSDGGSVAAWSWERYGSDIHINQDRLAMARTIVDGLESAIADRELPWQKRFRKGYVAFQRSGGYNVILVDMIWNKPLRVSLKTQAPPSHLGIANPYPELPEVWSPTSAEWGWHVSSAASIDPSVVVDIANRLQSMTEGPESAPTVDEIPQ